MIDLYHADKAYSHNADAEYCDRCGELTDTQDLWVHNQEVWCCWCIKEVKDGNKGVFI